MVRFRRSCAREPGVGDIEGPLNMLLSIDANQEYMCLYFVSLPCLGDMGGEAAGDGAE
jgi:hypothetical protein